MLWIIGIAVGVAQRDDFLSLTSGSIYLENLVKSFIAHPEISGGIPNRPLGKTEARSQHGQLCFSIKESPKFGRKGLKFERHLVRFSMTWTARQSGNQQQGQSGYRNLESDAVEPRVIGAKQ